MEFLDKYFIAPILAEQGYNIVNTITYAVLAFALLYLIYKIFRRIKFRIDFNLFLSVLPFVVLGSALRAFVDAGLVERSFWAVSPGIYLLVAGLFLISLFASFALSRKKWNVFTAGIGASLLLVFLIKYSQGLEFENLWLAAGIALLVLGLAVGFYLMFSKLQWKWISGRFGFSAFSAQLFDATVTAMILFFVGGWEKHPLPRFFIEEFGAFSFLPMKLAVVIPVVYILSKELKDRQLRNFLLIAIAVLGLAEGLRNLISLVIA